MANGDFGEIPTNITLTAGQTVRRNLDNDGYEAVTPATLNGSSLVTENPASATSTPTASSIPISDGSGNLDGWITYGTTSGTSCEGNDARVLAAGTALSVIVNRGVQSGLAVTDEGVLHIHWALGEVYDVVSKTNQALTAGQGDCTDNAINYLIWTSGTTATLGTSEPTGTQILIAKIITQNNDIVNIIQAPYSYESIAEIRKGLRKIVPAIVTNGLTVSEDTDVTNVWDVTAASGAMIKDGYKLVTEASPISSRTTAMVRWFHSSSAWTLDTNAQIDITKYDPGTNLAAVTAAKYYKSLFMVVNGIIHWIYPQAEYATEAEAIAGPLPSIPAWLVNYPTCTAVVLKGNATAFPTANNQAWIDARPMIRGNSFGPIYDHASLANIGTTSHSTIDSNLPTTAQKAALAGTGTPGAGNVYVTSDDSRLTNNRTPNAHAFIDTTGHSASGLTTGHVVTATGATTYAFQDLGLAVAGYTAKTAPVDADYIPLMDSETTPTANLIKKLSWSYVKSILKTYFDGLYVQVAGDIGGTTATPTVTKIHSGATQLSIQTITDGQFLKRVGTDIVSAAGSDTPEATASVTGGLRLTGDLGGTATSPTVPKLPGVKALSFTQATSSPALLLDPPNTAVITKVVIVVDTAAASGAPTCSVGVSGTAGRDMATTDSNLLALGTYIYEPYTACGTDGANISLTITPDSQTFAGRCYLHYVIPV